MDLSRDSPESGGRAARQDDGGGAPAPETLGREGRVLEGLVTTLNDDGSVNVSPMGPIVLESMEWLWLRMFKTSTTFANLRRDGCGVFHVTDDAELLAASALGLPSPAPRTFPTSAIRGAVLADACRWYAFVIERFDDGPDRTAAAARVIDRGALREFFGFNRAKHAVVEAAILATRIHLTGPEAILAELSGLEVAVRKTGAAAEHRAMKMVRQHVEQAARRGE